MKVFITYSFAFLTAAFCCLSPAVLTGGGEHGFELRAKGLEVQAISLDVDLLKWCSTITEGNYNWLNYTDLKSWQSPAAQLYNVVAAPAMLLLDKDKKIIAKPSTAQGHIHSLASKQF